MLLTKARKATHRPFPLPSAHPASSPVFTGLQATGHLSICCPQKTGLCPKVFVGVTCSAWCPCPRSPKAGCVYYLNLSSNAISSENLLWLPNLKPFPHYPPLHHSDFSSQHRESVTVEWLDMVALIAHILCWNNFSSFLPPVLPFLPFSFFSLLPSHLFSSLPSFSDLPP